MLAFIIAYYVTVLSAFVAFLYGWVWNIITLFNDAGAMEIGELVVRIVGIPLAIVGAVLGYF
jgi:hypothetical protein